ncbi:F-box/LRR-repeat protein At3g48880-like [Aristolochia californica]|uniref:F-box/LRR-repeat protein At3g48880-like n=1 Tax=Aristolochia californica TaxID=171875 RepID=UPI0035D67D37
MENTQRKGIPETRKWNQMDSNILVNIFEKLLLSDLLLGVSHVCREWRMAASQTRFFVAGTQLNLLCVDCLSSKETTIYFNLLRMAMKSTTNLDRLQFSEDAMLPEDVILAIAQRSTSLKSLYLPQTSPNHFSPSILAKILPFWKNLLSFEAATFRDTSVDCIRLIGNHCKKLTHLGLYGIIQKPEAQAIVTCFPEIQSLDIRTSFFSETALDTILDGAKNLKKLNLMHAICGDERDMNKFTTNVLKARAAKNLKREVGDKLDSLEKFMYCGGKMCRRCSWFYMEETDDLFLQHQ